MMTLQMMTMVSNPHPPWFGKHHEKTHHGHPSFHFARAELIDAVYDDVVAEVGNAFKEKDIVDALRKANYDPDAAIVILYDLEKERKAKAAKQKAQKDAAAAAGAKAVPPGAQKAAASASKAGAPAPSKTASASLPAQAAPLALPPVPPIVQSQLEALSLTATAEGGPGTPSTAPSSSAGRPAGPRIAIVVVGHVDAGKSTLVGRLLADTGAVPGKVVAQLLKESKASGKGSFGYAWLLDEDATERERGVTTDVGTRYFSAHGVLFTLLDSPGHRDFVPRMIEGVAAADVAVLVVDARPGEFESGFSPQGQTREHALLCRACGITHLIVAVNKMDAVGWARGRFEEIARALLPWLVAHGYKAEGVRFVPVAGLSGVNLVRSPSSDVAGAEARGPGAAGPSAAAGSTSRGAGSGGVRAEDMDGMLADLGLGDGPSPAASTAGSSSSASASIGALPSLPHLRSLLSWYKGPACPTVLEACAQARTTGSGAVHAARSREEYTRSKPFRMVVMETYRSGGGVALAVSGRVEAGWVEVGTVLQSWPYVTSAHGAGGPAALHPPTLTVKHIQVGGSVDVPCAVAGDTVTLTLGGAHEEHGPGTGQVLAWKTRPPPVTMKVKARIATLPTLPMPLIQGMQMILHSSVWNVDATVTRILRTLKPDGHTDSIKPRMVGSGAASGAPSSSGGGVHAIVRIRLSAPVCLETFSEHKRLGRFILRYSGRTVAAGMVLKMKPCTG